MDKNSERAALEAQVAEEARQLAAAQQNAVVPVAGTYTRCHICGQVEDVVEFERIGSHARHACATCMPGLHGKDV